MVLSQLLPYISNYDYCNSYEIHILVNLCTESISLFMSSDNLSEISRKNMVNFEALNTDGKSILAFYSFTEDRRAAKLHIFAQEFNPLQKQTSNFKDLEGEGF